MSATNSSTIPSNVSWSFAEDSSFQIPNNLKDVVYHPSLNVLLVFTHDNQILIFDATSGVVYKKINSIGGKEGLKCCYLPTLERLVVTSNDIISTRKDHNGVLLLDNLLQQNVQNPEDVITAVLSLNDAIHLLEASSCLDSVGVDNIAEVFKDLEQEVFRVKEATKSNHKEAKWATVCLKRPQGVLLKALNSLLMDMKRMRMDLPGLSVISSLVDQVSFFSTNSELLHPLDSSGVIDKCLMHNECVRRSTFKDWPHPNYKWALPIPMAQAGFYYHPNTTANNGDDRAMCFVCNVCLIYWEATDEPWSEHERHSPHCPFVKGEYTQNVPISATHATEPARLHSFGDDVTNIGCTTSDRFFATVLSNSYVVVWDINTFLKEYAAIHVSLNDPVVNMTSKAELLNCCASTEVGDESQKMLNGRELPGCDVNIGSTCIISQPSEIHSEIPRPGNSKNFLIVGATFNFHFDGEESNDLDMMEVLSADGKSTDVMMLNRLNQEKNGGLSKSESVRSSSLTEVGVTSSEIKESIKRGKAVACVCLLVYSLTSEPKRDAIKSSTPNAPSAPFKQKQNSLGPKKSIGKIYFPPQDSVSELNIVEDILDDDQDIQIVDFKLPLSFEAEEVSSKSKPKIILNSNSDQTAGYETAPASAEHLAQNLQEQLQNQAILCIPLPSDIQSSRKLSIKFILPTQDGCRLLVVVGVEPGGDVNDKTEAIDGDEVVCWTLIYKVSYYKSRALLDAKPLAMNSHKEMITSACLLPTDACQLLMYNDEDSSSDDNLLVVNVKGESSKGHSVVKKSGDNDAGKWESAENDLQDYQLSMKKLFGSILVVTSEGSAIILSLTDLSIMSTFKSGQSNKNDSFISATYCSGIDRICLVTRSNQLKFFSLKPAGDQDSLSAMDGSTEDASFDSVDGAIDQNLGTISKGADQSTSQLLMAQKKLNADVLIGLRRLVYYKNLTPRFVSTVPPHWKEVVQEQQQRKHPQHLHQHGEGVQHTRSWKLQTDSTASNDENIFELVLPVPTIVGHVLLRFTLNHSIHHSTPPPQIRATLLRQKPNSKPGQAHDLDEHIDFGLAPGNKRNESFSKDHYIESLEKKYKAKVVYGPIDLADHVDLSGSHGTIPMSSKLLMRDWSKTLLFHFKVINLTSKSETQCIFPQAQTPSHPKQTNPKKQDGSKTNELESVVTGKPPSGPSSSSILGQSVRFKPNDLAPPSQGHVTMQEISITIRKFRKFGACQKDQASKLSLSLSSLENRMAHLRRLNRSYMLENSSFHERLLEMIAGKEKLVSVGSVKNVKLHLALDILIWIINVTRDEYCSEQTIGRARTDVLKQLQGCMAEVLKTCLLCSDRSLAHKYARMFAACFITCNHSSQLGDPSISVEFQTSLLTALINCLPLVMTTSSAGAIHWFFVLFNHVKHLDPSLASLCCGELLTRVAEEYGLRNDNLHAFLRTKLGLCGSPLDPEVFDLDPSLPGSSRGQAKVHQPQPSASAQVGNSYAGVVMGQSSLYGSVLGGAPITSGSISIHGPTSGFSSTVLSDEGTFKDLMYLLDLERNFGATIGDSTLKNEQNSRFMTGLLESEPLHFTCHSASDGTRMEELDAATQSMMASTMQPSAMVGTNDSFGGPFNDAMMVFDAATGAQMNVKGGHFGSLSGSAGTSMDDSQLQQLHNKQMMLLKLQMQKKKLEQKLAETTKAMAVGSAKQSGTTTSNLFGSDFQPPAPKNTPFFMTPPLTPSEIYPNLFSSITLPDSYLIGGKNSDGSKAESQECGNFGGSQKLSLSWQQTKNIFQSPTPYALVIDRVHSGARRFIVLDFGKPICLTDVIIPACSDVASMSIDVWLNSERVDGQRLVESNDIWSTNLIMCDILPPPICRFLKVTTIRRYGGNTGRSKIPIGSFYGHTFIVPWQRVSDMSLTSMLSSSLHLNLTHQSEAVMTPNERNQATAQLNIFMSLLEDIQCSYGMARSRLSMLVSSLMLGNDHATSLMLLPKAKYTLAEDRVVQAYHKTTQLQIQLNLAKRAVYRLQKELGLHPQQSTEDLNFDLTNTARVKSILSSINTDTLKYLAEQLSSVLLGLSAGIPPSINVSIGIFQSPFIEGLLHAESLFSSLCVLSPSRKLQTTTGVLLARTCGDLPWWGDFFGKIFFEFFAADQKHIFPQDRLFILMVYLGQKSLCSSSAGHVLESILGLLSKTLMPLHSNGESSSHIENLDLTLISWLLLFVSKSLDNVSSATYLEEGDKQPAPANNGKIKDVTSKWSSNTPYLNNRWNFLQAEDVLSHSDSSGNSSVSTKPLKGGGSLKCSNRRRIYARIVQQKLNYPLKLVHQKKHLWKNDLISGYHLGKASNGVAPEPLKKTKLSAFFKAMMSVKGAKVMPSKSSFSLVDSEDENTPMLNNSLSGNPISDFSGPASSSKTSQKSGSCKKLIGTSGVSKREGGNQIIMDGWDLQEWDPVSLVSRTTCLSLVRGLYNLILSLDINCHVDLFIMACKVLTRIMTSSKPTIQLSEVMTMQDVEKLLTLACGGEYNGGQKLWGGAWTSHIIICFLQDILEAERLGQHHLDINNSNDCQASPSSTSSANNNPSQMVFSPNVQSAMQCEDSDEEDDDDEINIANNSAVPDLMADCKFDEEMSMLVDALVHDEEMSNPLKAGINEALSEEQVDPTKSDWFDMKSLYAATETLDAYGFWNYMSDKEVKLSKSDWKDIDSFDSSENLNDSNSTWKFANAQPPPILPQDLSHLHLQHQVQQQKQQQASTNNNNKFSNNNNAAMSFNKATFQSKLPVPFFGVSLPSGNKSSPSSVLFHQQPFKSLPPTDYAISQAVSLAVDSRLEQGLELTSELKLKTMLALESNVIQSCLLQPLHSPDAKKQTSSTPREAQVHNLTDPCQMCPSTDMLSVSFGNLFKNLSSNRINLEDLLDLWLTLNDSLPAPSTSDQDTLLEGLGSNLVPIDDEALSSLLHYVAQSASLNDRTWTLLFKCLMLVEAYRDYFSKNIAEDNEGSNLVEDPNFANIVQKFLSGSSRSRYPGSMDYKVGPLLVKTFHEFICSASFNRSKQKGKLQDVLLSIVAEFSSQRGPFYSCNGPVDAQTLLVDDLSEMVDSIRAEPVRMSDSDMTRSDDSASGQLDGCLDLRVCLQVISNITSLVMLHISTVEPVLCHSSSEAFFINPRFCFTGLFQRTQKNGDNKNPTASSFTSSCRDSLILSLLKLLDQLLRLPLPPAYPPASKTVREEEENQPVNYHHVKFDGIDSSTPDLVNVRSTEQRVLDVSSFAPEFGITDEQKASANQLSTSDVLNRSSGLSSCSGQQTCSHRKFFDPVVGTKGHDPKGMFGRSKMVADIILGKLDVMFNLYSSLSMCSRDALASFKNDEPYNGEDPFSVGDGVFRVLCTLNAKATSTELVVEPLYKFLAGTVGSPVHSSSPASPYRRSLSEPLLLFAMKVLDCSPAMNVFAELGGVEMVCKNLVKSNEQAISTEPSLISTMMQYFGSSKVLSSGSLRMFGDRNSDGLQNFAPIGTISSSSQVASPSTVLIQNTPPPRRARSAAWSYHFYPEEKWVDLTITLPFAILLKEVVIVPHFSSLDTCPSAIIIESSRDGYSPSLPLCSPISTSGLTNIRVKLPAPKISTVVTIRFHKPQDSTILGLTQIMIMGTLALGPDIKVPPESLKSYASRNSEDNILKPNSEWLRLFHHCLVKGDNDTFHSRVILAASSVPNFLKVCVSLLLISPLPEAEKVLLLVGRHTVEASLQLIDIILGGCGIALEHLDEDKDQNNGRTDGKISGNDHESYTAILYNLCTFQDGSSLTRLSALLDWLSKCARCAMERRHNFPETAMDSSPSGVDAYLQSSMLNLNGPSVKSILCISAILWDMKKKCNLKEIISRDFVGLMYNWSVLYSPNNAIKQAVDNVICSACYVRSDLFPNLVDCLDLFSRQTDDSKSNQDGCYDFFSNDAPVTDDIKADHQGTPDQSISTGRLRLTLWKLSTLATVSRAPKSLKYLEQIGFFGAVCKLLYEFFSRKSPYISSSRHGNTQRSCNGIYNSAELMPSLLDFLAEISQESYVKDLLTDPRNSSFWSPLLKNLCSRPTNVFPENVQVLYKWNLPVLESCAIKFITSLISCHSNNQHVFSCTLLETIRSTALPTSAFSSPLPGFLRRLLLQVILEDEKVVVYIRSKNLPMSNETNNQISHPRFGAGHYHRTTLASIQSTLAAVVSSVSNYEAASQSQLQGIESFKENKTNHGNKPSANPISAQQQNKMGGSAEKLSINQTTSVATTVVLYHPLMPDQPLPGDLTLPQLQTLLSNLGAPSSSSLIELDLRQWKSNTGQSNKDQSECQSHSILKTQQSSSLLQVFSGIGGLALLAERLPLLCPEFVRQTSGLTDGSATAKTHQAPPLKTYQTYQSGFMPVDWTPMEVNEEIYEDPDETPISPPYSHSKPPAQSSTLQLQSTPSIPPHSLIAFGIFLRLPGYSEVLLKERKKAQYLLRLVLGVTDDGNGGLILNSSVASSLPSLPFQVLKRLLDSSPLTTDDGMLLRRMCVEIGVIHLILACLSILGHHVPRQHIPGLYQEILKVASQSQMYMSTTNSNPSSAPSNIQSKPTGDDKGQNYWAKGTGFGTGSTASSWDAEHALLRQKSEEEHVTCLLQVLASFINPRDASTDKSTASSIASFGSVSSFIPANHKSSSNQPGTSFSGSSTNGSALPSCLPALLSQSCLLPALSSYLRNDSVLDMACHVPLYRALLELLQAIATCSPLINLLLPLPDDDGGMSSSSSAISTLLDKMKKCVDTYANRLKSNKVQPKEMTDDESEGLAPLIREIQDTSAVVNYAIAEYLSASGQSVLKDRKKDIPSSSSPLSNSGAGVGDEWQSLDEKYLSIMKLLQYDTFKMVEEEKNAIKFMVPHHYEANVKAAGEVNNPLRARRLAQEAVTLSTSLPLSADSSVFVRCDEDRLDVMKVLMTGPSGTPYSQGCFEFDVFFPTDYPNSPPLINLQTTGNHSIRFNPNLYNDGKVCLSIINTWHGRPEEKWNSQTSSFLQVLVSVQSLILVNEPYFNEPGYERSRGTQFGMASSREYDSNIRQATVKWAMLEMIKNPPPAFKQIIQWHFWLKKDEILAQVENWISDMESHTKDKRVGRNISQNLLSLKRHYAQLKEEFSKLPVPENVETWTEDEDDDDDEGEEEIQNDEYEDVGISFSASSKADNDASL